MSTSIFLGVLHHFVLAKSVTRRVKKSQFLSQTVTLYIHVYDPMIESPYCDNEDL